MRPDLCGGPCTKSGIIIKALFIVKIFSLEIVVPVLPQRSALVLSEQEVNVACRCRS